MTTDTGQTSRDLSGVCNSTPVICAATRHGTATAYQAYRCRCPVAIRAQARYRKRLRLLDHRGVDRIVPAVGTIRRFHALQAIGWTRAEILRRLGVHYTGSWPTKQAHVNAQTAEAMRRVYADLADSHGPSRQTAAYARRMGWLPPLWWDDDTIDDPQFIPARAQATGTPCTVDPVVVERLLDGQPPLHVTKHERAEAVRLLASRGTTVTEISRRLHMSGGRVAQIVGTNVIPPTDSAANNDCREASA